MGPNPTSQPTRSKRGRPADEPKKQDKDKGLYHCDYCHKDLSNVPRIKCAVCPDFDLCLECFSVGAQIWPHSNDHAYRVVDNLSFPLFHPEWGADEELLLLEAIDMYGLGNWGPDLLHRNSVADHVGMKGGQECRQHYYAIYVDTDTFPEPKPAPEMAQVHIQKLIEAHRSSGQQRMTVARDQPPPSKRPRQQQQAQERPPQALGQAAAEGAESAVQAGEPDAAESAVVKVEERAGAGALPAQTEPMAVKDEAGLVKREPVPGPVGLDESAGVKHETLAWAAEQRGAVQGASTATSAEQKPPPPPSQQQVGEKGRKHAGAAAAAQQYAVESTARLGEGAAGALSRGETEGEEEGEGKASEGRPASSGQVAPHTSTANFGLRLRAASVGDDLATTGLATPRGVSLGGSATKSPADGGGVGLGAGRQLGLGGAVVGTSDAQQAGYHVKRNEFDPEYDNEAETIVAELEFSPDDTPQQVATKLRLVEIYNRRLDEREARKAFVLDRGLLNVRKQQAADRRRTSAERDLHARLRVFARYLSQDQFEALAEGMAVEARLRARIAELCEYRQLGLRTFEQLDDVEALLDASGRKKDVDKPPPTSKSKPQRTVLDNAALQSELIRLGMPHAAASLDALRTTLNEGKNTGTALQAWRSRRGALLDITSLPDAEPLTQKERALCASERYLPSQYLAVKAALLKVQEAKGQVARADVRALPFQVDPARLLRLLDFMTQQGWVRQAPVGA